MASKKPKKTKQHKCGPQCAGLLVTLPRALLDKLRAKAAPGDVAAWVRELCEREVGR